MRYYSGRSVFTTCGTLRPELAGMRATASSHTSDEDIAAHQQLVRYIEECVNRASGHLTEHRSAPPLSTAPESEGVAYAQREKHLAKVLARLHLKYKMASELAAHDTHGARLWSAVSSVVGKFAASAPKDRESSLDISFLERSLVEHCLPPDEISSWAVSGTVDVMEGSPTTSMKATFVALDSNTGDLYATTRRGRSAKRLATKEGTQPKRTAHRGSMALWIKGPVNADAVNAVARTALSGSGDDALVSISLTSAAGLLAVTIRIRGEAAAQRWIDALLSCGWTTGSIVAATRRRSIVAALPATALTAADVQDMDLAELRKRVLEYHSTLVHERDVHASLAVRCRELEVQLDAATEAAAAAEAQKATTTKSGSKSSRRRSSAAGSSSPRRFSESSGGGSEVPPPLDSDDEEDDDDGFMQAPPMMSDSDDSESEEEELQHQVERGAEEAMQTTTTKKKKQQQKKKKTKSASASPSERRHTSKQGSRRSSRGSRRSSRGSTGSTGSAGSIGSAESALSDAVERAEALEVQLAEERAANALLKVQVEEAHAEASDGVASSLLPAMASSKPSSRRGSRSRSFERRPSMAVPSTTKLFMVNLENEKKVKADLSKRLSLSGSEKLKLKQKLSEEVAKREVLAAAAAAAKVEAGEMAEAAARAEHKAKLAIQAGAEQEAEIKQSRRQSKRMETLAKQSDIAASGYAVEVDDLRMARDRAVARAKEALKQEQAMAVEYKLKAKKQNKRLAKAEADLTSRIAELEVASTLVSERDAAIAALRDASAAELAGAAEAERMKAHLLAEEVAVSAAKLEKERNSLERELSEKAHVIANLESAAEERAAATQQEQELELEERAAAKATLAEQLAQSEESNSAIATRLHAASVAAYDATAALETTTALLADAKENNGALQSEVDGLKLDVSTYEGELLDLRAEQTRVEVASLAEVEALRAANAKLQHDLTLAEESALDVDSDDEDAALRLQAMQQVRMVEESQIRADEDRIAAEEKEIAALRTKLEESERAAVAWESRSAEMTEQLETAASDAQQMRAMLAADADARENDLLVQVAQSQAAIEAGAVSTDALKQQLVELTMMLESERAISAGLQQTLDDQDARNANARAERDVRVAQREGARSKQVLGEVQKEPEQEEDGDEDVDGLAPPPAMEDSDELDELDDHGLGEELGELRRSLDNKQHEIVELKERLALSDHKSVTLRSKDEGGTLPALSVVHEGDGDGPAAATTRSAAISKSFLTQAIRDVILVLAKQTFALLDDDRNGELDRSDVGAMFSNASAWRELLADADTDGDSRLDEMEWVQHVVTFTNISEVTEGAFSETLDELLTLQNELLSKCIAKCIVRSDDSDAEREVLGAEASAKTPQRDAEEVEELRLILVSKEENIVELERRLECVTEENNAAMRSAEEEEGGEQNKEIQAEDGVASLFAEQRGAAGKVSGEESHRESELQLAELHRSLERAEKDAKGREELIIELEQRIVSSEEGRVDLQSTCTELQLAIAAREEEDALAVPPPALEEENAISSEELEELRLSLAQAKMDASAQKNAIIELKKRSALAEQNSSTLREQLETSESGLRAVAIRLTAATEASATDKAAKWMAEQLVEAEQKLSAQLKAALAQAVQRAGAAEERTLTDTETLTSEKAQREELELRVSEEEAKCRLLHDHWERAQQEIARLAEDIDTKESAHRGEIYDLQGALAAATAATAAAVASASALASEEGDEEPHVEVYMSSSTASGARGGDIGMNAAEEIERLRAENISLQERLFSRRNSDSYSLPVSPVLPRVRSPQVTRQRRATEATILAQHIEGTSPREYIPHGTHSTSRGAAALSNSGANSDSNSALGGQDEREYAATASIGGAPARRASYDSVAAAATLSAHIEAQQQLARATLRLTQVTSSLEAEQKRSAALSANLTAEKAAAAELRGRVGDFGGTAAQVQTLQSEVMQMRVANETLRGEAQSLRAERDELVATRALLAQQMQASPSSPDASHAVHASQVSGATSGGDPALQSRYDELMREHTRLEENLSRIEEHMQANAQMTAHAVNPAARGVQYDELSRAYTRQKEELVQAVQQLYSREAAAKDIMARHEQTLLQLTEAAEMVIAMDTAVKKRDEALEVSSSALTEAEEELRVLTVVVLECGGTETALSASHAAELAAISAEATVACMVRDRIEVMHQQSDIISIAALDGSRVSTPRGNAAGTHALSWSGGGGVAGGGAGQAGGRSEPAPSVSTAVAAFAAAEMNRLRTELAVVHGRNDQLKAALTSAELLAAAAPSSSPPRSRDGTRRPSLSRATQGVASGAAASATTMSSNSALGGTLKISLGGSNEDDVATAQQLLVCLATINSLRGSAEAAEVLHERDVVRLSEQRVLVNELRRNAQAAEWNSRNRCEALQSTTANLRSAVDSSSKALDMERMRCEALLEIAAVSEEKIDALQHAMQQLNADIQMQQQIEAQLRVQVRTEAHARGGTVALPRHPEDRVFHDERDDHILALQCELEMHTTRSAQLLQQEKMEGWQRSSKLREMYLAAMEERTKLGSEITELRLILATRTQNGGGTGGAVVGAVGVNAARSRSAASSRSPSSSAPRLAPSAVAAAAFPWRGDQQQQAEVFYSSPLRHSSGGDFWETEALEEVAEERDDDDGGAARAASFALPEHYSGGAADRRGRLGRNGGENEAHYRGVAPKQLPPGLVRESAHYTSRSTSRSTSGTSSDGGEYDIASRATFALDAAAAANRAPRAAFDADAAATSRLEGVSLRAESTVASSARLLSGGEMGSGQSEDQFWESSALLSELEARESRSPPGAFPSTAARGGSGGGGVGGAAVDTRAAAVRVGEEEEEEIEDHEEAFQAATRRRRSSKFTGTNPMLLFKGDRGVDQHHRRVHIDRHGSVDIRGSP